jgi:hypothetical protein
MRDGNVHVVERDFELRISVAFVAVERHARRPELGRSAKLRGPAKVAWCAALAIPVAVVAPITIGTILGEASAEARLQCRIASRRIKKLGIHAAGIVLRAAGTGARIGKSRSRRHEHQDYRGGGERPPV